MRWELRNEIFPYHPTTSTLENVFPSYFDCGAVKVAPNTAQYRMCSVSFPLRVDFEFSRIGCRMFAPKKKVAQSHSLFLETVFLFLLPQRGPGERVSGIFFGPCSLCDSQIFRVQTFFAVCALSRDALEKHRKKRMLVILTSLAFVFLRSQVSRKVRKNCYFYQLFSTSNNCRLLS